MEDQRFQCEVKWPLDSWTWSGNVLIGNWLRLMAIILIWKWLPIPCELMFMKLWLLCILLSKIRIAPGSLVLPLVIIHQQNFTPWGSHIQLSYTVELTSRVLLCHSWHSQAPLEPSNVLSDAAGAFSSVLDSLCSYRGVSNILQYLI